MRTAVNHLENIKTKRPSKNTPTRSPPAHPLPILNPSKNPARRQTTHIIIFPIPQSIRPSLYQPPRLARMPFKILPHNHCASRTLCRSRAHGINLAITQRLCVSFPPPGSSSLGCRRSLGSVAQDNGLHCTSVTSGNAVAHWNGHVTVCGVVSVV